MQLTVVHANKSVEMDSDSTRNVMMATKMMEMDVLPNVQLNKGGFAEVALKILLIGV